MLRRDNLLRLYGGKQLQLSLFNVPTRTCLLGLHTYHLYDNTKPAIDSTSTQVFPIMKSFSKLFSKAKNPKSRNVDSDNASNPSYEAYRHFDTGGNGAALPSYASPPSGLRHRERNGYERKCGTLMNIMSLLAAISVIGMLAHLITLLKSSTNTRILWPHNVMLKAWPTTGSKATPLYLLLAAGSVAALVNIAAIIVSLCIVSDVHAVIQLKANRGV